jgi:hypothetical protein
LVWFLLIKSGYQVKVGLINGNVRLFLPTKNKIYGVPFFRGDDEIRQYVINLDNIEERFEGSLLSYDENYPEATRLLDMNIYQSPLIKPEYTTKDLSFSYQGTKYELSIKYDKSAVKFYEFYPYSNLEVYFNSAVSDIFRKSVVSQLKEITQDKPAPVAANMILRFVQTAFEYKTDQQQFNREKPLFAEETIFYDYSDCEDRSVLFAYLVKNILELPVVGIDYPGHVATAVLFNTVIDGDKIEYKGKHYTICDPTYINAYIGMSQEKYKNEKYDNIIEM